MSAWRRYRPMVYLALLCVSLLGLARVIEPLMALSGGGGGEGLLGTLRLGQTGTSLKWNADDADLAGGLLDQLLDADTVRNASANSSRGAASRRTGQGDNSPGMSNRLPDDPLFRAVVLHHDGRLEEAEAIYCDLIAADGSHASARRNLAILHYQRGEIDEAWQQVEALRAMGRDVSLEFLDLLSRATAAADSPY